MQRIQSLVLVVALVEGSFGTAFYQHQSLPSVWTPQRYQSTERSHARVGCSISETSDANESSVPISPQGDSSDSSSSSSSSSPSPSQLQFGGVLDAQTNPLPASSEDEVRQFFANADYRNLLITAGGARESSSVDMDVPLLELWTSKCQIQGTALPVETDEVFRVQTGGLKFPGLFVQASVILGIKFLNEDPSQLKYEVSAVRDNTEVSGLAPVVWVFDKLVGSSDENENANLSCTTISYEMNEQDQTVIFKTTSSLVITVQFPSVLLKILPTNKEKAEAQGGKAVVKALQKDVTASIEAYEQAYLSFLETS